MHDYWYTCSSCTHLQEEESLKLEISELEQSIETTKTQIVTCGEVIKQYQEQVTTLQEQVDHSKVGAECRLP